METIDRGNGHEAIFGKSSFLSGYLSFKTCSTSGWSREKQALVCGQHHPELFLTTRSTKEGQIGKAECRRKICMPCIGQAYVVQELVGLSDASKLE
jgi:hypothetical protein